MPRACELTFSDAAVPTGFYLIRNRIVFGEPQGAGKGRKPLSPPQHTVAPEREERSGWKSNFRLADQLDRTA